MSNLALLASLGKPEEADKLQDQALGEAPASLSSEPSDAVLEAVMEEFRTAPDSRAALRSLKALIARLR